MYTAWHSTRTKPTVHTASRQALWLQEARMCVLCAACPSSSHSRVSSKFQANFRRWFGWFIRLSQPGDTFFILSFQSLELMAIPSTELSCGKKARGDWRSRMMPTLGSSSRWTGRWCPTSMAWLEDQTTSASLGIFLPAVKHGPFFKQKESNHQDSFLSPAVFANLPTSLGEATVSPSLLPATGGGWGLLPALDLTTLTLGNY